MSKSTPELDSLAAPAAADTPSYYEQPDDSDVSDVNRGGAAPSNNERSKIRLFILQISIRLTSTVDAASYLTSRYLDNNQHMRAILYY